MVIESQSPDQQPWVIPLGLAVRELLQISDLLDASLSLRLAAYRDGFAVGRELGRREGHAAAHAELEASYHKLAHVVIRGESFAELERRRWGPGGRAHFGDPRPDDHKVAGRHE